MKKLFSVIVLLITSTFLFSQASFTVPSKSLTENSMISLSCDWDFYWGKFIQPDSEYTSTNLLVPVPDVWNNYDLPPEQKKIAKTGKGSGSYRLKVKNLKPETEYSFYTYNLCTTAFKVFANGKEIFQSGIPTEDWEKTKMKQKMDIATFKTDSKGEVDLVLWASNREYRKAGFRSTIQLQEADLFLQAFNQKLVYYNILSAILLTIIVYSLLLFLLKKDKSSLYLAIFVLTILLRVVFNIFPIANYFFPGIPYQIMLRMEFIAVFFAPAAYTLYIESMNQKIFKKVKGIILAIPGFVLLVLDFTLPIILLNRLVIVMQAYMFIIIFVDLFLILFRIFTAKDMLSITIILTLVIIGVGALSDILLLNFVSFIKTSLLAPSFVVFAMAQTALIAYLQNKNQLRVEELNKDLVETNKSYYRFVPREFLDLLSKKDITELGVGEWRSTNMAIMSADIRNFTSMSERLNEMQVFELVNTYLERIAPVIRRHNGIIEKYLGDGIIAIFPDSAESALYCAIEMQEEMINLRKDFLAKGFPDIRIGIGVHYGNVVIGTGGDNNRMTEISLSDDIDVAVKTEASTKIYKRPILVTRKVLSCAANELKKQNRKFDFYGKKVQDSATNSSDDLFYIYTDKTGNVL